MDVMILPPPIKSKSDSKHYRHIKLSNGLQALLISDENLQQDCDEFFETESEPEDTSSGSCTQYFSTIACLKKFLNSCRRVPIPRCICATLGAGEDFDESDDEEVSKRLDKTSKGKQAAAALCVGVGSFSDPDEIPGLAHFLEHMVFMGSAPYPNENHFDMFINRHGGEDNAFTDCERTIFKFEINPSYLKEALKIWSQFFISPLMKKSSIDREVQAVDSEFEMALVDDDTRSEQLIGIFSKQGHPIGKFLWGNKKTLKTLPARKGIKVYNALRQFHKKYYNANKMSLVVQSVEDLDTLQKFITDIFKDVPNNAEGVQPHFEENVPFPSDHISVPFQLCHIIPIKQIQELRLMWFLPPQHQHYRTKPLHYLSWLVGHEGSGSLLSLLKKEHLALGVCAECETSGLSDCSLYSVFAVEVTLTDKGCAEYEKVLDLVFQYMQLLRTTGPVKRIFKEMQQIEDIDFAYTEEENPLSYVEDLCENIQLFPPEEVISGDHLLVDYNVKVLKNVLDELLPRRCLIFYFNQTPICNIEVQSQREPWFGTTFSVISIAKDWVSKWSDESTIKVHPDLQFPTPNPFIASDFSLVDSTNLPASTVSICSLPIKYPSCSLWFKQDTIFKLPKAFIRMHLINSVSVSSPENFAYLDLLIGVLKHEMAEDVYHADAASLTYGLSASSRGGLIIKVSGYSDKLVLLLITILQHFVTLNCSHEVFEEQKLELRRNYHNQLISPKKLCKDLRLSILEQLRYPLIDKYTVSNSFTYSGFSKFLLQFRSRFHLDCLVQGNYNEEQAIAVFEKSTDVLNCNFLDRSESIPERILQLAPEKTFIKVRSLNSKDDNSVITVYIQYGCANVRESSLMQLLSVCMEEPCFDILRTKKQLGYVVYATEHNTSGILGLSVNVHTQNSKFSVEHVAQEILRFITVDFNEILNKMSADDYETQVQSLITLKSNEDNQLEEDVDRNWDEILLEDCNFDRLLQEVKHLKEITLENLKEFYKRVCLAGERVLVVQVRGNSGSAHDQKQPLNGVASKLPAEYSLETLRGENDQADAIHIESLQSFIKSGYYYPVSHVQDVPAFL